MYVTLVLLFCRTILSLVLSSSRIVAVRKMKLTVLVLLVMMMSFCLVEPRKVALGGTHGQEQRNQVEKSKIPIREEKGRDVEYKEASSTIDNHHTIPRESYSPTGPGSSIDDGSNG